MIGAMPMTRPGAGKAKFVIGSVQFAYSIVFFTFLAVNKLVYLNNIS